MTRTLAVAAVSAAAMGMAVGSSAAATLTGSSTAGTLTLSNPRILVHYDLSAGQEPENVTVEPDGNLDVVLARAHQIERVTPSGQRQLLATLPAPPDGGVHTPVLGFALATGIVRTADGTLYVGYAAGDDNFTGIWRIRPGGQPERIVALSAASFPNGLTLDEATGLLYLADSTMATIWRVPLSGGTPTAWASGSLLSRNQRLGVNGLKFHNGAIWASDSDQNTFLRIPITDGGAAAKIEVKATGLTFLDDFVFVGVTDTVIGAENLGDEVVLIRPDGQHSVLLKAGDGIEGPTAVAIDDGKLYVMSAAYVLQDPNILVADIES
jgi:hypothetical protein